MKVRSYGMLELVAKKQTISVTYMGSMSSRVQDVQESLSKLIGKTLAARFMKSSIQSGCANYCFVAELPRANAPVLFGEIEAAV
jgi:hypothetical protein